LRALSEQPRGEYNKKTASSCRRMTLFGGNLRPHTGAKIVGIKNGMLI
jgi:hypothetical protein